MSKQNGLIKLKGSIGGIAFYESGGQHLARIAKGPGKDRISKDPAFARTRENNKEFGGAATAAKALRISLAQVVQTMSDRYFVSRLTKTFKEIGTKDITGARGQRGILLSANKTVLENLNFDEGRSFSSVFNAPFTATHTAERTNAGIAINSFLPGSFIYAPAGATHFALIHALGVVSDYVYEANLQDYEATDPELNGINVVSRSTVMPVSGAATGNISMAAVLPGSPTMTDSVSVVQCLGIEFYQRVGGSDYLLAQGNAMKVIKVF
jgi:hypothetical protein